MGRDVLSWAAGQDSWEQLQWGFAIPWHGDGGNWGNSEQRKGRTALELQHSSGLVSNLRMDFKSSFQLQLQKCSAESYRPSLALGLNPRTHSDQMDIKQSHLSLLFLLLSPLRFLSDPPNFPTLPQVSSSPRAHQVPNNINILPGFGSQVEERCSWGSIKGNINSGSSEILPTEQGRVSSPAFHPPVNSCFPQGSGLSVPEQPGIFPPCPGVWDWSWYKVKYSGLI